MAERKTYTAEDFKGCNGRRVWVEATLTSGELDADGEYELTVNGYDVSAPHSAIVEILPEEIGVGDLVRMPGGAEVTVKAIVDEGERVALIKYSNGGGYDARLVSHLTLVERGQ